MFLFCFLHLHNFKELLKEMHRTQSRNLLCPTLHMDLNIASKKWNIAFRNEEHKVRFVKTIFQHLNTGESE
jgi:hypothetical protein